jgi:small-conductance mechanosensitive channel
MNIINEILVQLEVYFENIIQAIPRVGIAILVCGIIAFLFRIFRVKTIKYLKINAEDVLLVNFSNSIFKIINIIVITLMFLYIMGFGGVAGSILGAAGISAFVIGFAMKDIGENFLAGIIMAFHRPFRLGDTVMTAGIEGVILEMSLRDTHIKTFDGKDVYVPNGQIIKNPLYNYTIDGFLRGDFTVGVSYDTDIESARALILAEVKKVPGVLTKEKPPRTHVVDLNMNTIEIQVHYWINTFDENYSGLEIKSQAQSRVVEALLKAKIELPTQIVEIKNS